MWLVPPEELCRLFERHGLVEAGARRVPLRDGKAFHVGLFRRR